MSSPDRTLLLLQARSPWVSMRGKDVRQGTGVASQDHRITSVKSYRAGYYRVREGRQIVVTPAPGAGWREVRLFLLGSAWGVLCHQRGVLVLHASAVRVENAAVAFCAHAGMGKSTLAAWLTVHSYALVSDDLCRVDIPAQG